MARKPRRLAPRDAFIGVREEAPPPQEEGQTPASTPSAATESSTTPAPPTAAGRPEAFPAARAPTSPPSPTATASTPSAPPEDEERRLRELAAALQASPRGYAEKLTIYLSAGISAALSELWEKTRRETGVKVGKATLAQAALSLVLEDPSLRIAAVERAAKSKLSGP